MTLPFEIEVAGDYVVHAMVDAPDGASDSFFVNIDEDPLDLSEYWIWDIRPWTDGFELLTVTGWGNGSGGAEPEFDPKVFNLEAGPHVLYIRGREAYTRLDWVRIEKLQP